jgi:hypothetical protein
MIYVPLLFVILALSFVVQEFMPVIDWAYHARILIVHSVFFCAAVTVPFSVMLLFALCVGFAWDARYYLPLGEDSELVFGFTILLLGLAGAFIQGVRPLFRRGRWELPVFMIGVAMLCVQLAEYLIISFERGGLYFPAEIWFKMLMTSLITMLAAPVILLLLSLLAKKVNFRIRMEGITRKYQYGDTLQT